MFLQAIVTGNMQSFCNKINGLQCSVKYINEYQNARLLFTETWININYRDTQVAIDYLKLLCGDTSSDSGSEKGGGVCVYEINERWCHPDNTFIKFYSWSMHIKILTVTVVCGHIYLGEFSQVIFRTAYLPKEAALELLDIIHEFELSAPDGLAIVNGVLSMTSAYKRVATTIINM